MKFLASVAIAAVLLWAPVEGAAQDGAGRNPLRDLTTANQSVVLSWDDLITGVLST